MSSVDPQKATPPAARLIRVTLDEKSVLKRGADIERERQAALNDLLKGNKFKLLGHESEAPYALHLAVKDRRLVLEVANENGAALETITLPLMTFRSLIRDYFLICESYFQAARNRHHSRLQSIDMGRRGLHDEGAELLMQQLSGKIGLDKPTARRLFTLVCVLQFRVAGS